MFGTSDASAVSQSPSQKTNGIIAGSMTFDIKHTNSVTNALADDGGQSPNYSLNEVHPMRHFVREHSNPEFAHICGKVPPQHRLVGASKTERGQRHSDSSLIDNSKRSSLRSKVINNHNDSVSAEKQQSSWESSYEWRKDDAVDSKYASNSYHSEFGLGVIKEDGHSSDKAILMHQEERDCFDNAKTYSNHIFNGYLQAPVSVNSDHLSFPVPPPVLVSGYTHANAFDMYAPSLESFSGYHMAYCQNLAAFSASQSFPSVEMTFNLEEKTEPVDDNLVVADLDHGDHDGGFWSEQDVNYVRGYCYGDGNIKAQDHRHREMVTPVNSSSGSSSWLTSSGDRATIENRWLTRENYGDDPHDETTIDSDVNSMANSRSTPASLSTSRTKLSSCTSLNGSPSKSSKLTRDEGRIKTVYPTPPSSVNEGQYEGEPANPISSQPYNDSGEWIHQSTVDTFLVKSTTAETVASDVQTHRSTNCRQQPMPVSFNSS